jgi:hypothetical protein
MNPKTQERLEIYLRWFGLSTMTLTTLSILAILFGKAWSIWRALLPVLVLSFTACGFNPVEGDFGPIEWVPEQKECKVKVKYPDGRVNYEMRPCEGGGHDLEVFGGRYF